MDVMELKPLKYAEDLRTQNDFEAFYSRYVQELEARKFPRYVGFCPFHEDKSTPNFNINALNGRYRCWACGATGSYMDFLMRLFPNDWVNHPMPAEITDKETLDEIREYRSKNAENVELERALDKRLSETAHNLLLQNPVAINAIREKRGYTIDTIKKYHLGFLYGALTFPIYDCYGNFVSLKVHKQYQTDGATNQLYPWSALADDFDYVLLQEGEPDTTLVRQMGFNAVTQIFGCNSWNPEFTKFFKGKTVYIAYDNDRPGWNAAHIIARELLPVASMIFIVLWPPFMAFSETHGEDTTDFFIKYKQTASQYSELLANAKPITIPEMCV